MSTIKKLVYIANARLPTEKAHGFQIVKMCEAFAQNSVRVILLHPFRHQPIALKGQNLFDYYGVTKVFAAQRLRNLDVVQLEKFLPRTIFTVLFFMHAVVWGLYAAITACRASADIYYTRDSAIAYWLTLLHRRTIYEAHGVPKRAHKMLLAKVARRKSLVIVAVLTSFIRRDLVKMGFPPSKVVVCPDGADLSAFCDLPSKEDCRRMLGLPEQRPIIGYVGRFQTLEMEKGLPELVRAAARLPTFNGQEPLIACVGGPMDAVPEYLSLARACAVPENRLRFVDRVPNREIPFWLRTFDVAVAPFPNLEHYAYFMSPLKLFEYMASGVPILTTDLPSIREVLTHGETGWLVAPGDPAALADGICHLLGNISLKNAIATEAQKASYKFSWRQRVATMLDHVAVAQ